MILVDSRHPELDLFLQSWRNRLNTRYLAGEALLSWSAVAPFATAAAFAQHDTLIRWLLWGALTALPAALYTAWKARSRLSRNDAASWLDERARTTGVFRAASEHLENQTGPGRVVAEADAERRSEPVRNLQPPFRRLALRVLVAVAVGAASVFVLGLSSDRFFRAGPETASRPRSDQTVSEPPSGANELTTKEAARRLFPEDQRLAALAEQALSSGDPGALDALIEQNSRANPAGQPPGSRTAAPKQGSPEGGQGQQGESPSQPGAAGQTPRGTQGPQKQGSGTGQTPSPGRPGSSEPGEEGSSDAGAQGRGRGGTGEPLGPPGSPGSDTSDKAFGPVRPGSSGSKLPLKEPPAPGLFEFVLPGADLKVPSAEVLAGSRRSAEAVITRTSPPLEFENSIRDYFLSLSQEASP